MYMVKYRWFLNVNLKFCRKPKIQEKLRTKKLPKISQNQLPVLSQFSIFEQWVSRKTQAVLFVDTSIILLKQHGSAPFMRQMPNFCLISDGKVDLQSQNFNWQIQNSKSHHKYDMLRNGLDWIRSLAALTCKSFDFHVKSISSSHREISIFTM